ncbi:MAG: PocR ligand-binding domain-containing protein, partial [Firmicutes bacterium]|nr:PocR ligand-binding domain-containing protein [Bacillota bacterium]
MRDEDKTKEQLICELIELRQKQSHLEPENHSTVLSGPPRSPRESLGPNCHRPFNEPRKYHISELIDIPLLQQLFDSFYELTGIMHAVLDVNANILSRTGWSDLCVNFHRVCSQTEQRCKQSDRYMSDHLQDGPYIRYQCLNGLIDYATPIIVEGQHLATIFMGQLFNEPPDEDFFRQQAQEFGFDEAAYIEALRRVNIVPEHQIVPIMEFYSKVGQVLASMGLERIRLIEAAEDKFLKAFHCFPVPVTISTFDTGQLIDVNNAWINTTGYDKREALGLSFIDLGAYLDLAERDIVLEEVYAQGCVRNIETSCKTKTGEVKTFLTSVETIYIENIPHLLSVHEDIT